MKSKRKTYILLTVVLLIWGAVMYEIFSFSATEEEQETASIEFAVQPFKVKERKTVTLNVNYRDPFLGKMYAGETHPVTTKKRVSKTPKPVKMVEPIVWPTILYKGIVSDTKEKNKVFMLIINGKTFLMHLGATENEVFLKEGNRESVYVKYKGNLNLIFLQE